MVGSEAESGSELQELKREQLRLWSEYVADTTEAIEVHRKLVIAMRGTVSWKLTAPLRAVRRRGRLE